MKTWNMKRSRGSGRRVKHERCLSPSLSLKSLPLPLRRLRKNWQPFELLLKWDRGKAYEGRSLGSAAYLPRVPSRRGAASRQQRPALRNSKLLCVVTFRFRQKATFNSLPSGKRGWAGIDVTETFRASASHAPAAIRAGFTRVEQAYATRTTSEGHNVTLEYENTILFVVRVTERQEKLRQILFTYV